MRIVIATNDGKNVNGHFAGAAAFKIFDVSKNGYELINEVIFDVSDSAKLCSPFRNDNVDRLGQRLKIIEGSKVLFVAAIGPTASARVVRNNVYPVKIDPPEPIDQVLLRMQKMLNGNPPIWLRRIMNSESEAKKQISYTFAVATKTGLLVDQHFGKAEEFYIYTYQDSKVDFLERRTVRKYCSGVGARDEDEDDSKMQSILEAISGCAAVFVVMIGERPSQILEDHKIKIFQTCERIEEAIEKSIQELELDAI
ncbi:MAG: NifB/NifX family molybdenum-iron cluster-binding protein [Desulfosporosinus sp.]|nr:NifB/NifX family molybdenum-iron cluster-binding protein [Desulfosporosinus sp.]